MNYKGAEFESVGTEVIPFAIGFSIMNYELQIGLVNNSENSHCFFKIFSDNGGGVGVFLLFLCFET